MKMLPALRKLVRRSMLGLCFAATVSCGGGDGGLPPVWVETDVLVADVDGDGRADVLTLAMYSISYEQKQGYLLVYLQTTTPGTFAAPVTYSVGRYPWRAYVSDIDGDTRPDLVITEPDDRVTWLMLQDAAHPGQFLAPLPVITGASNYEAVIADLNNDGAPDVAVGGGERGLVVRYQDPAIRGSFGPQIDVTLPGRPSNLAAGDVDGDGLADVLAWVYTNPAGVYPPTTGLVVAYQKPGGGFDVSGLLAQETGRNAGRLAIADVNADGRRDLFAFETPFSSSYRTQLVVVLQSATARSFDAPVYTSLAGVQGIDDAVLADLNQDTVPDTAVVGFFPVGSPTVVGSRTNLLMNDGLGAFALSAVIAMPTSVSRVTAGDLDGNGRNDIVLLGADNQCLVMFQSTSPGTFLPPRALR
jgi:hypothetical protein